ncbi:MAG: ISL3 family transposase, partial [Polyangiaceae bacterium]
MTLTLRYAPRRVRCPRCGVTTELVPWAAPMSWFTHAFEQTVGYLAKEASKTVVSTMMRVAWATVGAIVGRLVERLLPGDQLDGLTHIGVDELSYRKHHKYVTIVTDHVSGRVVWAREGKNADTLRAFFEELGTERCARLEAVTIDMSQAYIAAVSESAKNATIIFDRFHVQRLVQDALDEVRRAEVRDVVDDPQGWRDLKHTRFALLKNPWNLTAIEDTKLTGLAKTNGGPLPRLSDEGVLRGHPRPATAARRTEEARGVDLVGHALRPQALREGRTNGRQAPRWHRGLRRHRTLQRPLGRHQWKGPHHHPALLRTSHCVGSHRDDSPLLLRPHAAARSHHAALPPNLMESLKKYRPRFVIAKSNSSLQR